MVKTKNLNDLGVDLLNVYDQLRNGHIEKSQAKALAGVAGKVIDALKVQVLYNQVKENIDSVKLLETEPSSKKIINGKKK